MCYCSYLALFFPCPVILYVLLGVLVEKQAGGFFPSFCSCLNFEDCTLDCSCPHAYYPPLTFFAAAVSNIPAVGNIPAVVDSHATTDEQQDVADQRKRRNDAIAAAAEALLPPTSRQQKRPR